MTQQEIFDTVLNHLRAQGRAAQTPFGECQYRGPGGTSCAVGCLIPDELYDPLIERLGADTIMDGDVPRHRRGQEQELLPVMARIADHLGARNKPLLTALQGAHDWELARVSVPEWEMRMASMAAQFGLEYRPAEGDQS